MSNASVRGRLRDLLAPVVTSAGLDLEDVTVTPAGRRSVVRVVVDRDGGVPLDDVAEVSRLASARLDDTDVLPGAYVLEVSSPGVDRPLTEPRHWRRSAGRLVNAVLRSGGDVTGRVVRADDDEVILQVGTGSSPGDEQALRYADVVRGTVRVEFQRPEHGAP